MKKWKKWVMILIIAIVLIIAISLVAIFMSAGTNDGSIQGGVKTGLISFYH